MNSGPRFDRSVRPSLSETAILAHLCRGIGFDHVRTTFLPIPFRLARQVTPIRFDDVWESPVAEARPIGKPLSKEDSP